MVWQHSAIIYIQPKRLPNFNLQTHEYTIFLLFSYLTGQIVLKVILESLPILKKESFCLLWDSIKLKIEELEREKLLRREIPIIGIC